VDKTTVSGNVETTTTRYYMASALMDTEMWFWLIRKRWEVENSLHRPKDVDMLEDATKVKYKSVGINVSIIRGIVINLASIAGYKTVKMLREILANKIEKLFKLLFII